MEIQYKGIKVYYEVEGEGMPLLFLHGWGGSTLSFKSIGKKLQTMNSYKCIYIDFPPFGQSQEPTTPFTIYDYVSIVKILCDNEKLANITLIAHSFGGRVALIFENMYNDLVTKLVLVDIAGLKPKRSIKYHKNVLKAKLYKLLKIKKNIGSKDYQNLSPIMKQTFKNVINENLKKFAQNIQKPTLLFWGNRDKETPIYMAKKLNKYIKNSGLIIYENCGHFSYLEKFNNFVITVNHFINQ